jgi:hypothetical protein
MGLPDAYDQMIDLSIRNSDLTIQNLLIMLSSRLLKIPLEVEHLIRESA